MYNESAGNELKNIPQQSPYIKVINSHVATNYNKKNAHNELFCYNELLSL